MNCRKAQTLFAPHIMGDSEPGEEQYRQLETHLLLCQACSKGYEIRKQTIASIEQNKAIFAKALMTPEEREAAEQEEIKRCWKRMEAKLDELEAQEKNKKQNKPHRLLAKVSMAIFCLVISVSILRAVTTYSKTKPINNCSIANTETKQSFAKYSGLPGQIFETIGVMKRL